MTPYKSCKLNYAIYESECLVTAGVEVYSYTYIWDETNNSYSQGSVSAFSAFGTVENYSQNYCYLGTGYGHSGGNYSFGNLSGSVSSSGPAYENFTTASPLNPSHVYEIEIALLVEADCDTQVLNAKAKGTASATATVDMGTAGLGAILKSVSLT
jgi:hypothetical protein